MIAITYYYISLTNSGFFLLYLLHNVAVLEYHVIKNNLNISLTSYFENSGFCIYLCPDNLCNGVP